MLKRIALSGVKTGVVLAVTTTLAVMAASERETEKSWAAVNSICHIIDGDTVSTPDGFRPRESLIGLGINSAAMLVWGLLYEGALALSRTPTGPATAVAGAAAAYAVDYHVVPRRFTPGIEKRLSGASVFGSYVVLAVTLAASRIWNRPVDRSED